MTNALDSFIEEADMPQEGPVTSCDVCGNDLHDGEEAYATTLGYISQSMGGFVASESQPWLTVACRECGEKISEAVEQVIAKGGK